MLVDLFTVRIIGVFLLEALETVQNKHEPPTEVHEYCKRMQDDKRWWTKL